MTDSMPLSSDVRVIEPDAFIERVGGPINPYLSVVIDLPERPAQAPTYTLSRWREGPHQRALDVLGYMRFLAQRIILAESHPSGVHAPILFQGEDVTQNLVSASWQGRAGWTQVRLVPDLYYYNAGGYPGYPPASPAWHDRADCAIWRGSTTGILGLDEDSLATLPRYQLCRIATTLAERADVKISSVVQAHSDPLAAAITERLAEDGLLGDYVPMERMADYKLLVDIDGNANAWNFLAKLRLGCCILRVDSDWRQWFSERIQPWRHYVPVRTDLSDFVEKVDWCLQNDAEASAIAMRGHAVALEFEFEKEMDAAAQHVFALDPGMGSA